MVVGEGSTLTRWEDWAWSGAEVVGCSISFDLACIAAHRPECLSAIFGALQNGRVTDVAIRQQLIDIEAGIGTKRKYSLKALVQRHFGVELDKEDVPRLRYHEVDGMPVSAYPPEFVSYLKSDLEWTYKVWEHQETLKSYNVEKFQGFETYADFCLRLMSVYGIRTEESWVDQLMADASVKFAALQDRYKALGVMREDGSKDKKKLQLMVFDAYSGNPPKTDKGGIKTDRLTLEESGDPVLEALTGDGPIEKIITTYGEVLRAAETYPYNCRYNVLVSSGRTSSNFQQWPRGGNGAPDEVNRLRASFVPRPGWVYCSVDYTGAELVTLAQVCKTVLGHSEMAVALNLGQNLHTRLAARFAGIDAAAMAALVKAKDKTAVALRQAAKPVNFGLPGMMGAFRLVQAAHKDGAFFCELAEGKECPGSQCKDCLRLAQGYIRLWRQEWPEIPQYHNWIQQQRLTPFSTPITGFLRGGLFPSEAANHPFQHLASRGAKLAMQRLAFACYSDKASVCYGNVRPVIFAHDEIVAEIRMGQDMSPAAWEMARIMKEAFMEFTPDVKVEAQPALMSRWFKAADTVVNDKGELQIWQPSQIS